LKTLGNNISNQIRKFAGAMPRTLIDIKPVGNLESFSLISILSIEEKSGGDLENQQVSVSFQGNVTTDPLYLDFDQFETDGSDFRILGRDNVTALPFKIISWDFGAKTAEIYIKFGSLKAFFTHYFYIYGNNSSASDASSIDNTFTKYTENGALAIYHLDSGTGNRIFDSSGKNHHLDQSPDVVDIWNGSDAGQQGGNNIQLTGNSLDFNTVNDEVFKASGSEYSDLLPGTGDMTFFCWAELDAPVTFNQVFAKCGIVSSNGWSVTTGTNISGNDANIRVILSGSSGLKLYDTTSNVTFGGAKVFLAFTWSNSTNSLQIYVNGTFVATTKTIDQTVGDISEATPIMIIGGDDPAGFGGGIGQTQNGVLDEIVIIPRELNEAELAAIYRRERPVFTQGIAVGDVPEANTLGDTFYIADQELTNTDNNYLIGLVSSSISSSETLPVSDIISGDMADISLININGLFDGILAQSLVNIEIWFEEFAGRVPESEKVNLFSGSVMEKPVNGSNTKELSCADKGWFFNKKIGTVFTFENYPNANSKTIGKIKNIPFGVTENVECPIVEQGAESTLAEDINIDSNVIRLTETWENSSIFPESGTIIIQNQEIKYEGKKANLLLNVAGIDKNYKRGTKLLEKTPSVKGHVAEGLIKAISNVRILPKGLPIEDAVLVNPDDFTLVFNDNGDATITITDIPGIKKQVEILTPLQFVVTDILGGDIIVDIEGYFDETPKHYTDTDAKLINEIAPVFHKLIELKSNGAIHADIDVSGMEVISFDDNFSFNFLVKEQIELNKLLTLLAKQCFCRAVWIEGIFKLVPIKEVGSIPVRKMRSGQDTLLIDQSPSISIEPFQFDEDISELEVKFDIDNLLKWKVESSYRNNTEPVKEVTPDLVIKKTILAPAVTDSGHARILANKLLAFFGRERNKIFLITHKLHLGTEKGDVILINHIDKGIIDFKFEVLGVSYVMPNASTGQIFMISIIGLGLVNVPISASGYQYDNTIKYDSTRDFNGPPS